MCYRGGGGGGEAIGGGGQSIQPPIAYWLAAAAFCFPLWGAFLFRRQLHPPDPTRQHLQRSWEGRTWVLVRAGNGELLLQRKVRRVQGKPPAPPLACSCCLRRYARSLLVALLTNDDHTPRQITALVAGAAAYQYVEPDKIIEPGTSRHHAHHQRQHLMTLSSAPPPPPHSFFSYRGRRQAGEQ